MHTPAGYLHAVGKGLAPAGAVNPNKAKTWQDPGSVVTPSPWLAGINSISRTTVPLLAAPLAPFGVIAVRLSASPVPLPSSATVTGPVRPQPMPLGALLVSGRAFFTAARPEWGHSFSDASDLPPVIVLIDSGSKR